MLSYCLSCNSMTISYSFLLSSAAFYFTRYIHKIVNGISINKLKIDHTSFCFRVIKSFTKSSIRMNCRFCFQNKTSLFSIHIVSIRIVKNLKRVRMKRKKECAKSIRIKKRHEKKSIKMNRKIGLY